jgi:SAM-dependent methyltransferase
MTTNRPSDPTVAYYEANAKRFARETLGLRMDGLYEPFLALVPPGGSILDAGCGPGRDALAFLSRGYQVTAFDVSPEMVRLARELTGLEVAVLRLQDVAFEEGFDGIWACASLLHVPQREISDVLSRLGKALRPGGACYMSFKVGEAEEVRRGRLFTDHTVETLRSLLSRLPALEVLRVWETPDLRPDRPGERWVNALVRKRGWAAS